jgi:hypothetical protein
MAAQEGHSGGHPISPESEIKSEEMLGLGHEMPNTRMRETHPQGNAAQWLTIYLMADESVTLPIVERA